LNNQRSDIELNQYEKEYVDLKSTYDRKYAELYEEIGKIVRGENIPVLTTDDVNKYKLNALPTTPAENGIPDYWYKVIKNSKYFPFNEKDEEILKFLSDVRLKFEEKVKSTFTVEFHFRANEYFPHNVLTKTYLYDDNSEELAKTIGSSIAWTSQDKNPRIKITKKKVKKGKNVEVKTTEKVVESFFNIFADQEKEDLYPDEAEFIQDDLIPNSLEYYLNIMTADEDYEDEEGEYSNDDDEDEDEEDKKKKGGKQKKVAASQAAGDKVYINILFIKILGKM
jgi:hypothetical protein